MDDITLTSDDMEKQKRTEHEEGTNMYRRIQEAGENIRNRALVSAAERGPSQIIETTPPSSSNSVVYLNLGVNLSILIMMMISYWKIKLNEYKREWIFNRYQKII